MDVDLPKAIWNGMEMDVDPYVDPHVDFVAWISTLMLRLTTTASSRIGSWHWPERGRATIY
jgi:hypothetical protein